VEQGDCKPDITLEGEIEVDVAEEMDSDRSWRDALLPSQWCNQRKYGTSGSSVSESHRVEGVGRTPIYTADPEL
jgi:hypothetical protein